MANPIAKFTPGSTLTSAMVYHGLRYYVYPPCRLDSDEIRMFHSLDADLGYVGNAKRALAPETNSVFHLTAPNRFTGPEMDGIATVRDHHAETCLKLKAAGRLAQ